jgi:hypothetical protein
MTKPNNKLTWLFTVGLFGFASAGALAQDGYADRIQVLEEELEAIKDSSRAGEDVSTRIKNLEDEMEMLMRSMPADGSGSPPQGDEQVPATESPPAAGEQGSLIPMQRESAEEYLTGDDLLDASFPNSIPIPGSQTRFKISGYAKLDFVQDMDYVGDRFEFELATIPVAGTTESQLDGRSTLHAKESRIGFEVRSVARNEKHGWEFPLKGFLEVDFFDDRESFRYQPRLRHAYGVVGRFLAGRTWAITTDLSALAGTVDFSGGDSLYGGRVSQVRFEDNISDSLKYIVGIEDPATSIGNPSGLGGADRPSLPNFAGSLRWAFGNGATFSLGADVFRLEWQGAEGGPSDTEFGYAAVVAGRYPIGEGGKTTISGSATVGSGAAHRVISLSFDGGNDAVITPNGLDVMSHWQIYGGLSHYWAPDLNSTFSYALAELDNSEFQPGSAIHRAHSFHANLVWYPYKVVSTGIEIMWGERENFDGAKGDATRIQWMAKYQFN